MSTSQSGSLWLKSIVTPCCTKQRPTVVANSTVNILICSTHIFMFWQNLCQCNNNPSLPTTNPKWLHSCVCSVNNSANTLLLHSLNIRATQTLLPNMGRVYFVHIKFASSNLFHFYWYFLKKKKKGVSPVVAGTDEALAHVSLGIGLTVEHSAGVVTGSFLRRFQTYYGHPVSG